MIEQHTIDGRKVTVAYLDKDFEPVDRGEEALIKVIFHDDGSIVFGVPSKP